MGGCNHRWEMIDILYGYLMVEGCPRCGGRASFFSTESGPAKEEHKEGEHFWTHLGSSQATKFNLRCTKCHEIVQLEDLMGLMLSTCDEPGCEVANISKTEGKMTTVYVALCADSTHSSGKCISEKGIDALNEYFNQNIKTPGKKIVIVPCSKCCDIDICRGIVIADVGLTDIY
ncbi:MAG: hypothetical protein AB2L11_07155 [Syntrophobacteraceae bacterium]